MDKLTAMQVFVKVVESGSFVKAADHLDLSATAVSRHVAELEASLGTRLLQRTTRRLHLTDAGRRYVERCQQILGDLDEADAAVRDETLSPRGLLRVSVPASFGLLHLAPLLPQFQLRYPDVVLEVEVSDRMVDLVEEGYDLALRITAQLAPTLVARRLATIHVVPCASPAYIARHGAPETPQALADHECLVYTNADRRYEWRFGEERVKVGGRFRCNNGDMLRAAALAGEGIICEPSFLVGEDLRAGRLVPLLQDWPLSQLALHAVYPSRRHLTARVRAFVDFLVERIGDPPGWDAWMHP